MTGVWIQNFFRILIEKASFTSFFYDEESIGMKMFPWFRERGYIEAKIEKKSTFYWKTDFHKFFYGEESIAHIPNAPKSRSKHRFQDRKCAQSIPRLEKPYGKSIFL